MSTVITGNQYIRLYGKQRTSIGRIWKAWNHHRELKGKQVTSISHVTIIQLPSKNRCYDTTNTYPDMILVCVNSSRSIKLCILNL